MAVVSVVKTNGFTMLELLMVIVVVSLLASVAIPQFQSMAERARVTEAVQMINSFKTAQAMYKLQTGVYADAVDRLSQIGLQFGNTNSYWAWYDTRGDANDYVIGVSRSTKGLPAGSSLIGKTIYFVHDADGSMGLGGSGDFWWQMPSMHPNSPRNT